MFYLNMSSEEYHHTYKKTAKISNSLDFVEFQTKVVGLLDRCDSKYQVPGGRCTCVLRKSNDGNYSLEFQTSGYVTTLTELLLFVRRANDDNLKNHLAEKVSTSKFSQKFVLK